MNRDLFRLISTYEIILSVGGVDRPIRIDIFRSISDDTLYRTRIWMQNIYNLYPTLLNTGPNGEDIRAVHSSEYIDSEITTIIMDDPRMVTGLRYDSEEEFLMYIKNRILNCEALG